MGKRGLEIISLISNNTIELELKEDLDNQDIFNLLCDFDYACSIDWKEFLENVLYNVNNVLGRYSYNIKKIDIGDLESAKIPVNYECHREEPGADINLNYWLCRLAIWLEDNTDYLMFIVNNGNDSYDIGFTKKEVKEAVEEEAEKLGMKLSYSYDLLMW